MSLHDRLGYGDKGVPDGLSPGAPPSGIKIMGGVGWGEEGSAQGEILDPEGLKNI